ncbi:glucosamine-6-phosphate deaminase [Paenibacillus sp. J31TS4]|uniref:glucosamine-6-phosphate deaminase n=1 Tax=Paenibacillus sp. J31TS4 TaxID=2807195 RepID=UPI001BD060BB|nr:glucosamine-6-phosphate deaminase [Paenibacillus sp. J31TS4]
MNLFIYESNEQLNAAAANLMAAELQRNPKAVLGLATGSTPIGMYEKLVEMHRAGLVSFREATTYNLDEYVGLPRDHEESYYTFMNRHLFRHVDLPEGSTHLPLGNAENPADECLRYDASIEQANGIDLQILGIGHNGHVGFNEPGDELHSGTHIVQLAEETRKANARFFASLDEVPSEAITVGMGVILKARTILLLARGADKAEILKRALRGPITTQVPASLLQLHPNLIVMADSEAGRLLQA